MTIDTKTVAKIARLARIRVPDAEQPQLANELGKILDWVAQLDEVNVAGIEPLANVHDAFLRYREDKVTDGNKTKDILANAPSSKADFFTVPKVIE